MNEMVDTAMQTPIEIALQIDSDGMTTARALYDFLEMDTKNFSRWATQNIEKNEFYDENVDWWGFVIVKNGNECKDYRLTMDFAKHLSMESHSAKGKVARKYFVKMEDKVKQQVIDRSQLSSSTRALYGLIDGIAKVELEQKRQEERLNRIEETQNAIVDTLKKAGEVEDFQKWANDRITQIAESPNYASNHSRQERYAIARSESYNRLKKKRNCRLDDRVQKAVGRAISERPDIKKSELQKINKMYVIANDKDLKLAYEMVIREMMICYCTK